MGVECQNTRRFRQYTIQVFQYLIVPKSNHLEPMHFDALCSFQIVRSIVGMLSPIDLNYQLRIEANKIRNEVRNGVLAAKFHAKLIAANGSPKFLFGVGHFISEASCVCGLNWFDSMHLTPIPTFPLTGGRG